MKLYNHPTGVLLVGLGFVVVMYHRGKYQCACDKKTKNCVRREIFGVQYVHILFYIFLGLVFPSYFWTFQTLGLLFEMLERILEKNETWTMKHLGGCLSEAPATWNNSIYNFKVYRGMQKYMNPVDRLFHIENSKNHFWHGSASEVLSNIIGFGIGMGLAKLL